MGWDKGGRYYTRSKRVNGRAVREYIGGGAKGEEVARQDALRRQQRQAERDAERAREAYLDELNELMDLLVSAALTAAGYRRTAGGGENNAFHDKKASPSGGTAKL